MTRCGGNRRCVLCDGSAALALQLPESPLIRLVAPWVVPKRDHGQTGTRERVSVTGTQLSDASLGVSLP